MPIGKISNHSDSPLVHSPKAVEETPGLMHRVHKALSYIRSIGIKFLSLFGRKPSMSNTVLSIDPETATGTVGATHGVGTRSLQRKEGTKIVPPTSSPDDPALADLRNLPDTILPTGPESDTLVDGVTLPSVSQASHHTGHGVGRMSDTKPSQPGTTQPGSETTTPDKPRKPFKDSSRKARNPATTNLCNLPDTILPARPEPEMLSGIVLPPVPQTPDRTRHNVGRMSDAKPSQPGTTQPKSGTTTPDTSRKTSKGSSPKARGPATTNLRNLPDTILPARPESEMLSGIVLPPVPQTPDRTRHNAGSPDRRRSQQPKTSEKKVRVSDTKASQSGTTQPVSGQTGTHQPPVTLPSLREERKVLKRTKKALDEQISRQEGRTPAKGEAIRQVNEEIGTMHTLIRNGRVAIRTACATDAEVALQLSMQKHHLSLYRQCIALQRRKLNLLQQHRS